MPKKKRARYGEYCTEIKGRLYGSVNIPLGNGKYQRKRKRVNSAIEAKQWAEHQLNKGGSTDKDTFTELADWYAREFLVAPVYKDGKKLYGLRTYKTQKTTLERLKREFGGYKLNALDVDVLRRYKRRRLQDVSITAINREFVLMNTMFHKAIVRKWMRENPFQQESLIEIALESKGRKKLTDRLVKRLLARSRKSEQPLLHYLCMFLVHTGARPSEAYPYGAIPGDGIPREPVTWKAILDHKFQAVRLVSFKGRVRKERAVPVSVELEAVLRRFYAEANPKPDDLLFPFASCKRAWATLCRSVGIKGYTIRAFRSYFNSWLVEQGYDEVSRMLIMGHEKLTTNLLYSSVTPEFIARFRATPPPPTEP